MVYTIVCSFASYGTGNKIYINERTIVNQNISCLQLQRRVWQKNSAKPLTHSNIIRRDEIQYPYKNPGNYYKSPIKK